MASKGQARTDKASSKQSSLKPTVKKVNIPAWQQTHPALLTQRAALDPRSLSPQDVLQLQRTIGNRAVDRLLARPAQHQPIQKENNNTVLPDNLKAGIEDLSGLAMDDVKVHYNSSKPAKVQALAFTHGTDIYLGANEEKHLAHEAWHVVQQKQGRVKPTLQMKGVEINDDDALEREAAIMGEKAVAARVEQQPNPSQPEQIAGREGMAQTKRDNAGSASLYLPPSGPVIQRTLNIAGKPQTADEIRQGLETNIGNYQAVLNVLLVLANSDQTYSYETWDSAKDFAYGYISILLADESFDSDLLTKSNPTKGDLSTIAASHDRIVKAMMRLYLLSLPEQAEATEQAQAPEQTEAPKPTPTERPKVEEKKMPLAPKAEDQTKTKNRVMKVQQIVKAVGYKGGAYTGILGPIMVREGSTIAGFPTHFSQYMSNYIPDGEFPVGTEYSIILDAIFGGSNETCHHITLERSKVKGNPNNYRYYTSGEWSHKRIDEKIKVAMKKALKEERERIVKRIQLYDKFG